MDVRIFSLFVLLLIMETQNVSAKRLDEEYERGLKGEKGEKGDPGYDGLPGQPGDRGNPGLDGLNGKPGLKGDRGIPGLNGPIGMPGLKGDRGMPGVVGLNGRPGLKGDTGMPGVVGLNGRPGLKGDTGMPGVVGLNGRPGLKGDTGMPGVVGLNGRPGLKGDTGMPGVVGLNGRPGLKGDTGMPGVVGLNGMPGLKGDRGMPGFDGPPGMPGPVGEKGEQGAIGFPGIPGICPTRFHKYKSSVEEMLEFGLTESPAEVACRLAPDGVISGNYFIGPKNQAFEVYCNMTTRETCIKKNTKTLEVNHNSVNRVFWLSAKGVDMKKTLYNMTPAQIIWLRNQSTRVRQTLKYHCLDSVPYSKQNLSSSVKLLTGTDVVIGPQPTSMSPFFYTVPADTDECKEGSTEWKSTIIELESDDVFKLPIVDLWINDVRNADQRMSIESIEVCFG